MWSVVKAVISHLCGLSLIYTDLSPVWSEFNLYSSSVSVISSVRDHS